MKKSLICISILLIIVMTSIIFTGCNFKDYASNETENLFKNANYTNLDGTKIKLSKKQNAGDGLIISLDKPVKLNTIVLGENKSGIKSNINKFTLSYYDKNTNNWLDFYQQDLVETYRYCVFNTLTTNKIKLIVNETKENRQWNLKKFTGHLVEHTYDSNFRVMGYATAGYAYESFKDPAIFNTVTHINMFDHIRLNADGTLTFTDKEYNKQKINGEDYFQQELNNIVNAIGDRDRKIIVTILPKVGTDPEALHTEAFTHSDIIINTINNLYEKYPMIDGFAFDYEYPYSGHANKAYGKFVKELKTSMPSDKLLALALSSWQFKPGLFPHKALEYVDMVEMMAYDQFEEHGYHSTFQTSMVNIVEELTKLGLDKYLSKINIGLPFYSRPTDCSLYWGDYNIDQELIGKYNNIVKPTRPINKVITWDPYVEEPLKDPVLYYNSPQMIQDKTAFAIDNKLGGMMIWHLGCDIDYNNDLSLLKAIQNGIDLRK